MRKQNTTTPTNHLSSILLNGSQKCLLYFSFFVYHLWLKIIFIQFDPNVIRSSYLQHINIENCPWIWIYFNNYEQSRKSPQNSDGETWDLLTRLGYSAHTVHAHIQLGMIHMQMWNNRGLSEVLEAVVKEPAIFQHSLQQPM